LAGGLAGAGFGMPDPGMQLIEPMVLAPYWT
jgi:hypothetical protein